VDQNPFRRGVVYYDQSLELDGVSQSEIEVGEVNVCSNLISLVLLVVQQWSAGRYVTCTYGVVLDRLPGHVVRKRTRQDDTSRCTEV
jgi:hypothetical protein